MKIQKADWQHWSQMMTADPWQCVALSLDLEPRGLDTRVLIRDSEISGWPEPGFFDVPEGLRNRYRDRIDILRSRVDRDHRISSLPANAIGRVGEISLADFAQWATEMNWSIPDQLKELAAQSNAAHRAAADTGDLSTKERGSLLTLVITMAVEGYKYDPGPARSPVTKEIADDAQRLGLRITDDTVRKYLKEASSLLSSAPPTR